MKGIEQFLVPYLIVQLVAVTLLIAAYKNTRLARLLFAILFIWASATNTYFGLTSPHIYLDYAQMALPFYRDFINGWFSHINHIMVPAIAVGQLLIGVGMLLKDEWVKWACVGAIIFLICITPLMVGSGFPFTIIVAWVAFVVFRKDEKNYLWKTVNHPKATRKEAEPRMPFYLSIAAGALALLASIVGLFVDNIYRDNDFVKTAWNANDWVTLVLVVPALAAALYKRDNLKAQLVWAGLLGYLIYNYAFYSFGSAFNLLFLFYIGVVSCAFYSLIALLSQLLTKDYTIQSTPTSRLIAAYLFVIALMLVAVEVPPSIAFVFSGKVPDIVIKSGHPTSIVYALDLPFIVPVSLLAVYWLWRKKSLGVVLSAIMLVKGAAYGLVLCVGSVLMQMRGIDKDHLLPFYLFISLGGVVGLIAMLRSVKIKTRFEEKPEPVTYHPLPAVNPFNIIEPINN